MAAELSTEEAIRDNPAKEQMREKRKRQSSSERGAGVGRLLFRAFPNLKSKPKILVLGLDYRTSFGLGRLMAFTLCEKNTVQLMFGLGRLVAFTL